MGVPQPIPGQVIMGTLRPHLDWMGGTQTEQQSEYMLCGMRYGSYVHARGLFCFVEYFGMFV